MHGPDLGPTKSRPRTVSGALNEPEAIRDPFQDLSGIGHRPSASGPLRRSGVNGLRGANENQCMRMGGVVRWLVYDRPRMPLGARNQPSASGHVDSRDGLRFDELTDFAAGRCDRLGPQLWDDDVDVCLTARR